jgi:hypothetical protein
MKDLGDNHTIIAIVAVLVIAVMVCAMLFKQCDSIHLSSGNEARARYTECIVGCSANHTALECKAACEAAAP